MTRKQRQQTEQPASNSAGALGLAPAPTSAPRAVPEVTRITGPEFQGVRPITTVSSAPRPAPTVEEVRRRAFELYLARNGRDGTPEGDWLRAERELRERAARPPA